MPRSMQIPTALLPSFRTLLSNQDIIPNTNGDGALCAVSFFIKVFIVYCAAGYTRKEQSDHAVPAIFNQYRFYCRLYTVP